MRNFYFTLLSLILLWASTFQANAAEPEARAVLERLQAAARTVETIQSDFLQEKHLSVFDDDILSKGKFYFKKPASLRWEYSEPFASGITVNGDKGRRWNELSGQDATFDVSANPFMQIILSHMVGWTSVDVDWLTQNYRVEVVSSRPAELVLTPRDETMGEYVKEVSLSFGSDDRVLESVRIGEGGGDYTLIRFVNTRVNEPLPQGVL